MDGIVFDIKELCLHDGPGIRTTVFMKGCPLRCRWCHNPEGLSSEPQLMVRHASCTHCDKCRCGCTHPDCQPFSRCLHACPNGLITISGKQYSPKELAFELCRSADFLRNNGGVTFSGGEPLFQPDFLKATLKLLKAEEIHLCMETSGFAPTIVFSEILELLDFIIMDIKLADDALHKKFTGVSNSVILQNFKLLKQSGKPCMLRTPLIPGITDTEENRAAVEALVAGMPHTYLPYNALAGAKYKALEMDFPMEQRV